jgi:hypothetical protein
MRTYRRAIFATCLLGIFVLPALSQDQLPAASTNNETPAVTENVPASPTRTASHLNVTFDNGQLTIAAENSTLREVLDAIHLKTGTKIEAPYLDPSRITVHVGPGDPIEVIAKFLYGIRFNYIILGTDSEVRQADRVIITARKESNAFAVVIPPKRTEIPQVTATASPDDAAAADPNGTEVPVEEAKKDDASDPDVDKDKVKEEDKDKVADKKDPSDAAAEPTLAQADGGAALPEEQTAAERIANLPEGMNPALASLYPSLFGGGGSQSSNATGGNPLTAGGQMPGSTQQLGRGNPPQAYNPVPIQLNSAGIPILPNNIPPEIWNLYPNNLIDLIHSGGTGPAYTGPPTPLIPGSGSNPQGVLWDQGLKPAKH